jgi:xylan 1,4-beta-xylosidase
LKFLLSSALAVISVSNCPAQDSLHATIRVDASHSRGPWRPIWRFFGADEPNYGTMKDGRKLLGQLGSLAPKQVYFRTHNLLTSGDGTPALKWGSTGAYSEDAQGKPVYDWTILDGIFDTYLTNSVRPYVQIGFMPKALSIKPEPYQHRWTPTAKYSEIYTGWAYPPNDYEKWGELAFQWAQHCVQKYGRAEVERWYWEVWNEPNIGYWRGTPQEFLKLHDHAVAGVRRALPTARVGGPDVAGAGGRFMRDFIEHCLRGTNYATGQTGTPLDFVAFHAKGAPRFVEGHLQMGIAEQLRTIDGGFQIIASYPQLKKTPIVIGECDPDGCAACQGQQLGYRNGTLYSSYTAASFGRIPDLADKHGVNIEGALTWAFEFEDQPWFAGFRALASNGITLPVFNVFRMFSRMSGQHVNVESDMSVSLSSILTNGVRSQPDIAAIATLDTNKLCILAWHYHDVDVPGPNADIALQLSGLPKSGAKTRLTEYRVDQEHGNAFTAWKQMGSPPQPTPAQYAELEKASLLQPSAPGKMVSLESGEASVRLNLSRQGVTLLVLEWDNAKQGR